MLEFLIPRLIAAGIMFLFVCACAGGLPWRGPDA